MKIFTSISKVLNYLWNDSKNNFIMLENVEMYMKNENTTNFITKETNSIASEVAKILPAPKSMQNMKQHLYFFA